MHGSQWKVLPISDTWLPVWFALEHLCTAGVPVSDALKSVWLCPTVVLQLLSCFPAVILGDGR